MVIKESKIRQYVRQLIAEARGNRSSEDLEEREKMLSGQTYDRSKFPMGGKSLSLEKEYRERMGYPTLRKPKGGVHPRIIGGDGTDLTPENQSDSLAQRAEVKRNAKNQYNQTNVIKVDDINRLSDQYGLEPSFIKDLRTYTALEKYVQQNGLTKKEGFRVLSGDEQLNLSPEEREQYNKDFLNYQRSLDKPQTNSDTKWSRNNVAPPNTKELMDRWQRTNNRIKEIEDAPYYDRQEADIQNLERSKLDIERILRKFHKVDVNQMTKDGEVDDDLDFEKYIGQEYDGAVEKASDADSVIDMSQLNLDSEDDTADEDDYEPLDDEEEDDDYDEDGIIRYDRGIRRGRASQYDEDDEDDDMFNY